MSLRILEQIFFRTPGVPTSFLVGCLLLLMSLQAPPTSAIEPPGFHAVDVGMTGEWSIHAQLSLRCPDGEKVDSITYQQQGGGILGEIDPGNTLAGVLSFELFLPVAQEGLCPGQHGESLVPMAVDLLGKCRPLGSSNASTWSGMLELSAKVQCAGIGGSGDFPQNVHEPTIRVENGGPPDQEPPESFEIFRTRAFAGSPSQGGGYGVRIRWPVRPRFAFEAGLSRSRLEAREATGAFSATRWNIDLHAVYRRPWSDRLHWLAVGGVGWQLTTDEEARRGEAPPAGRSAFGPSLVPSLGLGLELRLASRLSLGARVLGRYRTSSVSSDWSAEGQLGLVVALGR